MKINLIHDFREREVEGTWMEDFDGLTESEIRGDDMKEKYMPISPRR